MYKNVLDVFRRIVQKLSLNKNICDNEQQHEENCSTSWSTSRAAVTEIRLM